MQQKSLETIWHWDWWVESNHFPEPCEGNSFLVSPFSYNSIPLALCWVLYPFCFPKFMFKKFLIVYCCKIYLLSHSIAWSTLNHVLAYTERNLNNAQGLNLTWYNACFSFLLENYFTIVSADSSRHRFHRLHWHPWRYSPSLSL